jgi:ankyrin repeat protein
MAWNQPERITKEIEEARLLDIASMNPDMRAARLADAAVTGNVEEVKQLLALGTNKEYTDGIGQRPLHNAVMNGHTEIVKLLLAAGVEKETLDANGQTPLIAALENGQIGIFRILLDAKADTEARDRQGQTTLHYAAIVCGPEIIALLIRAGAVANALDREGRTPLHNAIRNRKVNNITMLLRLGADGNARDESGQTPLMLALSYGDKEIIARLIAGGVNYRGLGLAIPDLSEYDEFIRSIIKETAWNPRRHLLHAYNGGGLARTKRRRGSVRRRKLKSRKVKRN